MDDLQPNWKRQAGELALLVIIPILISLAPILLVLAIYHLGVFR